MEENKLILLENGEEAQYRVLVNIEDVNGKNYIVYSKDELNDNGDILSYVGTYTLKEDGNVKIISIKDDKTWEFIRDVLNSIQNEEEVK